MAIDDDPAMLSVTHNILKDMVFRDRPVLVECAHSAEEGKRLYLRYPDAAIILLDCVMETDTAGLDFVGFVRDEQKNPNVQIILRTGQPAFAPEQEVLNQYELNEYLSKTSETASNLRNRITAFLRNYATILALSNRVNDMQRRETDNRSLVGAVAHEIKTPLNHAGITLNRIDSTLSELACDAQRDDKIVELASLAKHAKQALQRSSETVACLFDSCLKDGPLITQSVGEVIAQTITDLSPYTDATENIIHFSAEHDFSVAMTPLQFSLLMLNLLQNAMYYRQDRLDLKIHIRVFDSEKYQLIEVTDNGPGIENPERVFEPTYTQGKPSGTGYGLAYCKDSLQQIGADINCCSVPGNTVFTLRFPKQSQTTISLANKCILIVDDDLVARSSLKDKLLALYCRVYEAENGLQAYAGLFENSVDAVIVDLHLQDSSGIELCSNLRDNHAGSKINDFGNIPIIAYSANPDDRQKQRFLKAGATAYVVKTSDHESLLSQLNLSLTNARNLKRDTSAVLSLAAKLHHDIATALLIVDSYGKLFGLHLNTLIEHYIDSSKTHNVSRSILDKLSSVTGEYNSLAQSCRNRHNKFWKEIKDSESQDSTINLIESTIEYYRQHWSTIHDLHVEVIEPVLPLLLEHESCVLHPKEGDDEFDMVFKLRAHNDLTRVSKICGDCSRHVLERLNETGDHLSLVKHG